VNISKQNMINCHEELYILYRKFKIKKIYIHASPSKELRGFVPKVKLLHYVLWFFLAPLLPEIIFVDIMIM
jgi:hypothetical protein